MVGFVFWFILFRVLIRFPAAAATLNLITGAHSLIHTGGEDIAAEQIYCQVCKYFILSTNIWIFSVDTSSGASSLVIVSNFILD